MKTKEGQLGLVSGGEMAVGEAFCIFGYQYHDDGNYKTFDQLLLRGKATEFATNRIRSSLISDEFFYAQKVNLPILSCRLGTWYSSDLYVPLHEFCDLRPATAQEIIEMECFGELEKLVSDFERAKAKGEW